ncbi:MAG: SLBB domain-containing protein [Planctomycetota bacterium]|nr:SLBB domain-containing protein [Planctomycetota bacterium]
MPAKFVGLVRKRTLRQVLNAFALFAAVVGSAGCATGGGGVLPSGQELTPQTEHVLNHAPKIAPVARELCKTVPPSYILEPGDAVLIETVRFDSPLRFAADQVIQPDGTVDLGKYGRIVVAGKRIEEVEICIEDIVNADADLIAALEEANLEGPERVNVRLIDPRGSQFYVLGAVSSPGAYPYAGRETVLDAILAAGGLADNARRCEIILSRPSPIGECRTVLPICWDNIVQLGDTTTNYQIMPGDRVFVPANGICDTICAAFKHDACPRCCYPQCPAGYASVRCPYPTSYDLSCPPYAETCPTGTISIGVPPAPAGPTIAPPAAPKPNGNDFSPEPNESPLSMIWRKSPRVSMSR